MKNKHLPRKFTDTNIIRCMLLNINEHLGTNYKDYRISEERYNCMIASLANIGLVGYGYTTNDLNTENLFIADIPRYNEWSKSNFYRFIESFVLPSLNK